MPVVIEASNGQKYEFSDEFDNLSPEEQQSLVEQAVASGEDSGTSAPKAAPEKSAGLGTQVLSALGGAADTITMDHTDEILGGLDYWTGGDSTAESIRESMDANAEAAPAANIAGTVAGALAGGGAGVLAKGAMGVSKAAKLAKPGVLPKAERLAKAGGKNAAIGAGYSLGSQHGRGEEMTAEGALEGAGLGLVGGAVGAGLGRLARRKPKDKRTRRNQTEDRQREDFKKITDDKTNVGVVPLESTIRMVNRQLDEGIAEEALENTSAIKKFLDSQMSKHVDDNKAFSPDTINTIAHRINEAMITASGKDKNNLSKLNKHFRKMATDPRIVKKPEHLAKTKEMFEVRDRHKNIQARDKLEKANVAGNPRRAVQKLIDDRDFFTGLDPKIQDAMMDAVKDPTMASRVLGMMSNLSLMGALYNALSGKWMYALAQGGARTAGKFANEKTSRNLRRTYDDILLDPEQAAQVPGSVGGPVGAVSGVGIFGGMQ